MERKYLFLIVSIASSISYIYIKRKMYKAKHIQLYTEYMNLSYKELKVLAHLKGVETVSKYRKFELVEILIDIHNNA